MSSFCILDANVAIHFANKIAIFAEIESEHGTVSRASENDPPSKREAVNDDRQYCRTVWHMRRAVPRPPRARQNYVSYSQSSKAPRRGSSERNLRRAETLYGHGNGSQRAAMYGANY